MEPEQYSRPADNHTSRSEPAAKTPKKRVLGLDRYRLRHLHLHTPDSGGYGLAELCPHAAALGFEAFSYVESDDDPAGREPDEVLSMMSPPPLARDQ